MMETERGQTATKRRYSLGDVVGFYAYLFAVGGAVPRPSVLAGIARGENSVSEIIRPLDEPGTADERATDAA
jgi:hypothetical protein